MNIVTIGTVGLIIGFTVYFCIRFYQVYSMLKNSDSQYLFDIQIDKLTGFMGKVIATFLIIVTMLQCLTYVLLANILRKYFPG